MKLYIECGTFKKVGEFKSVEHAKLTTMFLAILENVQLSPLIHISEWCFFPEDGEDKVQNHKNFRNYLQRTQFFSTIDTLYTLKDICALCGNIEMKDQITGLIENLKEIKSEEDMKRLLQNITETQIASRSIIS